MKIKNISPKDKLRFECKLLGSHQQFLGSVSISAGQLLTLPPGQNWSQQLPLFGEGESDESHDAFGDAEAGPPCILLAFEPVGGALPGASASNRASRASETQSRPSGAKAGRKTNGSAKGARGASGKALSLEERVEAAADRLGGDMGLLQEDDRSMVKRLDTLEAHLEVLEKTHVNDVKKVEQEDNMLQQFLQAIEEMKAQDVEDVQELDQMKDQLNGDVDAASSDLKILTNDTKELNDYITEKAETPYDSENGSVVNKQKAIRNFLLTTLQVSDEQIKDTIDDNAALREQVQRLRSEVRDKFLSNQGTTDEEINEFLRQYEELLDQHADAFKHLDQEANDNVDEFDKHGDLWKKLFSEGMDLEKK